jgi:enoyl-CoA hydratase/carnithine racemase
VATCDLAIAAEEAKFATPGVRIGLFCTTPMVALSRAIGRKRAMEMLLTGDFIDARTAADWGLVNSVVPAAQLHEATLRLARKVAEASGTVVRLGKEAFYVQIDLAQAPAYEYAKDVMSLNAMAGDAQEGIAAFIERRQAVWDKNPNPS